MNAYETMTRWLLAGQWILGNTSTSRDCLQEVLQAVGAGLIWEAPVSVAPDVAAKTESSNPLADGRRVAAAATTKAREIVTTMLPTLPSSTPVATATAAPTTAVMERKRSAKNIQILEKTPATVRESAEISK